MTSKTACSVSSRNHDKLIITVQLSTSSCLSVFCDVSTRGWGLPKLPTPYLRNGYTKLFPRFSRNRWTNEKLKLTFDNRKLMGAILIHHKSRLAVVYSCCSTPRTRVQPLEFRCHRVQKHRYRLYRFYFQSSTTNKVFIFKEHNSSYS